MLREFNIYNGALSELSHSKKLITTINAHSYNTLKKDSDFREALKSSDILLPDGVSVVLGRRLLTGEKLRKIAGEDLFYHEMKRVEKKNGKCFFLGSSEKTLKLIKERAKKEFPTVEIYSYSPPFKAEFTQEETQAMIDAVNAVEPDVLFIGMTAPKQEKWAYKHFEKLNAVHICCIGAVFDFFAQTVKRAPAWVISMGMEWFYRLVKEPRRMWRRYLVGNTLFVSYVLKEKILTAVNYSREGSRMASA